MNAIEWLCKNAPGYHALSDAERDAIMQFALLWSLFEAKVLASRGSARSIITAVQTWSRRGLLTPADFHAAMTYFRARYFAGGHFTHHFDHLHLRPSDNPALVRLVLSGDVDDPESIAATSLIIVYRFRNNLFHGLKWAYEIQGQLANFQQANLVLMRSMDLHEKSLTLA